MSSRWAQLKPWQQVLTVLAAIVAGYYAVGFAIALVPLAVAGLLVRRHRGRRRTGELLAADSLLSGLAGYMLAKRRRKTGGPVKVRGERYDSPGDARRAARELLEQLGNTPNGSPEWEGIARHVEDLFIASREAEER